MSGYQPGIPTGTVDLSIDYLNLKNNFGKLDTIFGVDHTAFSVSSQSGYHKIVHLIPSPITPAAVPSIGQLYDKIINDGSSNDTALFFTTGLGKNLQLTSNFTPALSVSNTRGVTFLPGGFIFQWGNFTTSSASTVAVTFGKAFPNKCFNVQLTYEVNDNSTIRSGVSSGTISTAGFTWIGSPDSHITNIYFIAIGN